MTKIIMEEVYTGGGSDQLEDYEPVRYYATDEEFYRRREGGY